MDDENGKKDFGHLILRLEYAWICTSFILQDGQFFFLLTYLTLSVLGLLVSPVFYSMMLLDIIVRCWRLNHVESVPFSEQRHQGSHGQCKPAAYVRHARIHPPVDLLHAAVHFLLRRVFQR